MPILFIVTNAVWNSVFVSPAIVLVREIAVLPAEDVCFRVRLSPLAVLYLHLRPHRHPLHSAHPLLTEHRMFTLLRIGTLDGYV